MERPRSGTGWDPEQYHRFTDERRRPFFDLLSLVEPVPAGTVADLGCGTGELTVLVHERTQAAKTIGIDNSKEMLAEAPEAAGVEFRFGDLRYAPGCDVIFANASLQWVPDHEKVLRGWRQALHDGGQVAVQVPSNADEPVYQVMNETIASMSLNVPDDPVNSVLPPTAYATILHQLGFFRQAVRLEVYGHLLESIDGAVEWVKGTNLVRVRRHVEPDTYDEFLRRYTQRLRERLGDPRPYFYPFKRILFWGRLGAATLPA